MWSSSLPPGFREPFRALANEKWLTEDGPHPLAGLGAIAARWKPRRSCRPCHPRAISGGHQRYPADNHGHSQKTSGQGAPPLTWGRGEGRNCMACKGSGVQIPSAPPPHRGRSAAVSRPASTRRLLA
jgi:hypothetical protein